MPHHSASDLSLGDSVLCVIFGLVVLCFSPRLVTWSIASKSRTHRWLLRRFGLGDTALATLPEESPWLGK